MMYYFFEFKTISVKTLTHTVQATVNYKTSSIAKLLEHIHVYNQSIMPPKLISYPQISYYSILGYNFLVNFIT